MINFVVDAANRHELEMGEISYFHLKKDQSLLYKIPADPEVSEDKIEYIYVSNKNALAVNATECKVKTGCEFEVKSSGEIDATLYISDSKQ